METEDQGDWSVETFDMLFVSILAKEKWDLILFVQPVGSSVNDGFRDMTMAEDHIRHSFSQHLDQMRERYLTCLLYTSPSPRDRGGYRMPSSAWKKKKQTNKYKQQTKTTKHNEEYKI